MSRYSLGLDTWTGSSSQESLDYGIVCVLWPRHVLTNIPGSHALHWVASTLSTACSSSEILTEWVCTPASIMSLYFLFTSFLGMVNLSMPTPA